MSIQIWVPVSLMKIFCYLYMNFRLLALRRKNVSYLQVQWKPALTSNTIVHSVASSQVGLLEKLDFGATI